MGDVRTRGLGFGLGRLGEPGVPGDWGSLNMAEPPSSGAAAASPTPSTEALGFGPGDTLAELWAGYSG